MLEIIGDVEHIKFESDNGYKIAIITDPENEVISIKGTMPTLEVNGTYVFTGTMSVHPLYGKQLDVKSFKLVEPKTTESILKYLKSGVIKGIGLSTAQKIVDEFGDQALEVIYHHPEKLSKIRGISAKKASEISVEYKAKKDFFTLCQYLEKYNIPLEEINKYYLEYKDQSLDIIKENPYTILYVTTQIPFNTIDKIALSSGLTNVSFQRIEACIKYLMQVALRNGNTCVNYKTFVDIVKSYLQISEQDIEKVLKELIHDDKYVLKGDFLTTKNMHDAEWLIAQSINKKLKTNNVKIKDIDGKIKKLEKKHNITLTPMQKQAILSVCESNINIITGGPGTGKTTITKFIVDIFKDSKKTVAIAAPTGKAAKRISDVTDHPSSTIHRLLEMQKYEDDAHPMEIDIRMITDDLLIIDEASMLDTYMTTFILRAGKIPKIVFLGDINQLPSVGAGKVLDDLIASGKINVVVLDKVFRQARQSNIILNAHRVNKGLDIEIQNDSEHIKDLDIFFAKSQAEMEHIFKVVIDKLKSVMDFKDFLYNTQILTPTKQGTFGTENINKMLQDMYNKKDADDIKTYGKIEFRKDDRIIQIKNNYDKPWEMFNENTEGMGIFNGEMGIITNVDNTSKQLEVLFDDGKHAVYEFSELDEIIHAYAITVHKSQGSEFDTVILLLPQCMSKLLTRNVLYTGITRAKKRLVIIGVESALKTMIKTVQTNTRVTNLSNAIKEFELQDEKLKEHKLTSIIFDKLMEKKKKKEEDKNIEEYEEDEFLINFDEEDDFKDTKAKKTSKTKSTSKSKTVQIDFDDPNYFMDYIEQVCKKTDLTNASKYNQKNADHLQNQNKKYIILKKKSNIDFGQNTNYYDDAYIQCNQRVEAQRKEKENNEEENLKLF